MFNEMVEADLAKAKETKKRKEIERKNRMTNREWLNSLSDEEMAEAIHLNACDEQSELCKQELRCHVCLADWLKKERVE